jgi:hypothetical protein
MKLKSTVLCLLFIFSAPIPSLVTAQGTAGANASTSSGAANADVMAPGGTGNAVPKGAGDTSASGVPPTGNTKRKQKKNVAAKRRAITPSDAADTARRSSQ